VREYLIRVCLDLERDCYDSIASLENAELADYTDNAWFFASGDLHSID
jgi:hypothetical protein